VERFHGHDGIRRVAIVRVLFGLAEGLSNGASFTVN
jgi:hypothetical protein